MKTLLVVLLTLLLGVCALEGPYLFTDDRCDRLGYVASVTAHARDLGIPEGATRDIADLFFGDESIPKLVTFIYEFPLARVASPLAVKTISKTLCTS